MKSMTREMRAQARCQAFYDRGDLLHLLHRPRDPRARQARRQARQRRILQRRRRRGPLGPSWQNFPERSHDGFPQHP